MREAVVKWLALALALASVGCAARRTALDTRAARESGFRDVQVDAVKGDFRIAVWSPGEPLEAPAPDCLQGWAWWFQVIGLSSGKTIMNTGGWWEAHYPDVLDYSRLEEGVLKLTTLTYDPRRGRDYDYVPFTCTTYRFTAKGGLVQSTELLLSGEPAEDAQIHRLVSDAVTALLDKTLEGEEQESIAYNAMAHLRNTGVERPYRARHALTYVWLYAGSALSVTISDFINEVDTILEIREGKD